MATFEEVKNGISKKGIQCMYDLLDGYETAVFPPVVTIYYCTTKDKDLSFQFTLEGLNVCEEEVGIWVTYSKDRTEAGRVHKQLDWLNFGFFEEDCGARNHCAKIISDWLEKNVRGERVVDWSEPIEQLKCKYCDKQFIVDTGANVDNICSDCQK